MKGFLSIQQPYFFPYIGYFQLINVSETHIIYDIVNFKKKGWISRNRILINSKIHYVNILIKSISQNKKISDIEIVNDQQWRYKLVKKIKYSYKKAKYFDEIFPLLEEIILYENNSLNDYLFNNISRLCKFLDIKTKIIKCSNLDINKKLRNKDLIIEIIKNQKFKNYINLTTGKKLYDKKFFEKQNIELKFINYKDSSYEHIDKNKYIENLSIIDMLFNIGKKNTQQNLKNFELN
tara:strand:- start:12 stop:719 length:708 start_codon:yes stop_codon:yes gene_type:complete